jgi:predicted CXXCH cytochrome family protein
VLTLLLSFCLAAAPAPAKGQKPHEPVGQAGCVREECHASVRKYAVVHGPVGVNACDACHELTDAESHTFRMVREKADMCTYCHEFSLESMPVVHEPVRKGECLGCHDPHGGTTKALIRENSTQALCNRCHESVTKGRTFLHTPVKEGACDSCHPPHGSRFKNLLDVAGPDLCLACHEGFDRSLSQAKFTHKALEQGCRKCHDPHGSKHRNATTQPVLAQCSGCHEKTVQQAMAVRFPHTPVLAGEDACVNCHTPHGSQLAKLVSDVPERVCMSCHKEAQKTQRGYVVPAVAELNDPNQTHKHGGIKDGTCGGCHWAHGSNQQLFLTKHYSKIFYQPFSPQRYELCFSCHDVKLVTEATTAKLTSFRNGERNLHALHVRDTKERGENCRVCHDNHAGGSAKLVKNIVTYGTWQMPVRYAKTATGGSCYPGCHPLYRYDRDHAIRNETGKPTTTQPAYRSIAGERPSGITLAAQDVRGREVRIPDDRGGASVAAPPTVLVVVRADQPDQTARALDGVDVALKHAGAGVRTIVIVSGSPAPTAAASLAAARREPILSDPDGSIASELEAHGFPTTLVVRGDGLEIARVAGAVETLAIKLSAYVELAAGRATPEQAHAAATTLPASVGDPPAQRDVRRIERLIADGRGDEAVKLLMKLPDGAIPNWRHNLLGARALIVMNRWPEAKDAAATAVLENPACGEAHFLLGQIHEHAGDWQRAAAEYRAARDAKN